MTDEDIIAQVSAILNGWTETPGRALASRVGENWLIGGFIDGTCFYKHTGLAPDGPDTPDDPIEAAHWLVAHVAGLRSPAPSGVFDSEEPEEIGEPDASPDIEPDSVGDSVDAILADSGGDLGVSESDAGPGDPDYSFSEPVEDVASDADEPEAETVTQLNIDDLKPTLRLRVIAESVRQSGLSADVLARVIELTNTLNDENASEQEQTSAQLELEQHNKYREKATLVEAAKQRKLAEIDAIETVEDALTYSVEDGWP